MTSVSYSKSTNSFSGCCRPLLTPPSSKLQSCSAFDQWRSRYCQKAQFFTLTSNNFCENVKIIIFSRSKTRTTLSIRRESRRLSTGIHAWLVHSVLLSSIYYKSDLLVQENAQHTREQIAFPPHKSSHPIYFLPPQFSVQTGWQLVSTQMTLLDIPHYFSYSKGRVGAIIGKGSNPHQCDTIIESKSTLRLEQCTCVITPCSD